MSVVLDASITIAWVYPTEPTAAVSEVFGRVLEEKAWVPTLWHLEIANVLEMNAHKQKNDDGFRDPTLNDLRGMRIRTDDQTEEHAWGDTVTLASTHDLTIYDACYLELARRRRLPLATLDKDLRRAASAYAIPLLGL